MLRRSLVTSTGLLAIVVLSGCTVVPPVEPLASVAPTSTELSVYACDDIAALDDVVPVFVTADGTAPRSSRLLPSSSTPFQTTDQLTPDRSGSVPRESAETDAV